MSLGDSHEDLTAALAARRELGHEYDKALAEGVVERMGKEVDARVDRRVAELLGGMRVRGKPRSGTPLAIVSLVLAIPLSAIAGASGHVAGLAVAWGGIAAVNFAGALRRGGHFPFRNS
jgi:hypothetical protein